MIFQQIVVALWEILRLHKNDLFGPLNLDSMINVCKVCGVQTKANMPPNNAGFRLHNIFVRHKFSLLYNRSQ